MDLIYWHFVWPDNVSPTIADHVAENNSWFSDLSDFLKKITEFNENLKLWRIDQMPLIATVPII